MTTGRWYRIAVSRTSIGPDHDEGAPPGHEDEGYWEPSSWVHSPFETDAWRDLGVLPWLLVSVIATNRAIPAHVTLPIGVSLHPSELLMAATGAYLLLLHMSGAIRQMRGAPALAGLAVIVLHSFGPMLNASSLTASEIQTFDQGLVITYLYALMALAAYHCAKSIRALVLVIHALIWTSVYQAGIAMVEGVTGRPFAFAHTVWQYVGFELDPRASGGSVSIGLNTRLTGELRAFSTAPHPLVLSAILATTTLITARLLLTSRSNRQRAVWGAAVALQGIGFAFTNSRTGMLVLAVGAVPLIWSLAQRPRRLISLGALAGGMLVSIAALSPNTVRLILDTFTLRQRDHNLEVRVSRIPLIWDYLERRPLVGAGYLSHNATVGQLWDNAYLQALTELGLVGAFALLTLILVWMASAAKIDPTGEVNRQLRFQTVLAGTSLIAAGFTLDAWTFDQFMPMCLILLALGVGRSQLIPIDEPNGPTDRDPTREALTLPESP
jgi:hypothetical protein